jgi:hypothetical protein
LIHISNSLILFPCRVSEFNFLMELKGMLNLRVKYIMDYGVRQRFKNQFVSLSLVLVPGILSGESNE